MSPVLATSIPAITDAVVEVVEFGGLRFDSRQRLLTRAGARVDLPPKLGDMLQLLIENRHRTVSKDELLRVLWAGEAVSSSVVPNSVAALRRVLAQDSQVETPLRTVRGRGYRFAAPVRVLGAGEQSASSAIDTAFVGRHQTLARLRHSLQRACGGRGGIVFVTGSVGIGKTRLLDELLSGCVDEQLRLLSARCTALLQERAFSPLLRALEAASARHSDVGVSLRGVEKRFHRAGAKERFALCEGAAQALLDTAQEVPLVVRLEDLQWADEATLQVVQLLSLRASERPLLLLATVRITGDDTPSPLLNKLLCSERVTRHYLRPLPQEQVAELLELLRPHDDLSLSDAEVQRLGGGNPFVLGEFIAAPSGALGSVALGENELRLPEAALGPAREQLTELPEAARQVVLAAAILGPSFLLGQVSTLGQLPLDDVLSACDHARGAGILALHDGGRGEFVSRALYEASYRSLSAGQRAVLHSRAAVMLARTMIPGDLSGALSVALHELWALPFGDLQRAMLRSLNAIQEARARGGYGLARRLLAVTLQASSGAVDRLGFERMQLHIEGALMAHAMGALVAAQRNAIALFEESIGHSDEGMVLGSALWASTVEDQTGHARLRHAINQTRERLAAKPASSLHRLLDESAARIRAAAMTDQAPRQPSTAPQGELSAGPLETLVTALIEDAFAFERTARLLALGVLRPQALLDATDEETRHPRKLPRGPRAALRPDVILEGSRQRRIVRYRTWACLRLGDRAAAERVGDAAWAARSGSARDPWARALLRAEMSFLEGRFEHAEAALAQGADLPSQPWFLQGRSMLRRAMGLADDGDGDGPYQQAGSERATRFREQSARGGARVVPEAIARLRSTPAGSGEFAWRLWDVVHLARTTAHLGVAVRRELVAFFEPLSDTLVVTPTLHVLGSADYFRGLLLVADSPDDARDAFELALRACQRLRAPLLTYEVLSALSTLPHADATYGARADAVRLSMSKACQRYLSATMLEGSVIREWHART